MLPNGLIVIWSGVIVDIPAGWHLCDGNAGTIDLQDRFVFGASGAFPVGSTGGAKVHSHDFTGDGHSHVIPGGVDILGGSGRSLTTSTDPAVGTTDSADGMPPYYALAFIQKIS